MHGNGVRVDNQRTHPHNIGEAQADSLSLYHGTNLWGKSTLRGKPAGYGYGGTCHLQIGHPWHDVFPLDHMISQEKLVTVKG
jgi:hypothetical protein